MIETLQEITEAASKVGADSSKVEADALKTKADCQRSLVDHSVSRYDEGRVKRGLGSPEKPVSKRRRQNSVGSAGMPTNIGPPKPLPEDIVERIPLPTGRGRVVVYENGRPVDTSPSRNTPLGAQGPLESQNGSSAPDRIVNPEVSSLRTLLQSCQSNPSSTDPEGLAQASAEIKSVCAQIEFPENWTPAASNSLLRGFKRNIHKNVAKHFRPAGLLDSFSASPNCPLRRLNRIKSAIDNGNGESCSACKEGDEACVRVSLVVENLADRRWKLTIREG